MSFILPIPKSSLIGYNKLFINKETKQLLFVLPNWAEGGGGGSELRGQAEFSYTLPKNDAFFVFSSISCLCCTDLFLCIV